MVPSSIAWTSVPPSSAVFASAPDPMRFRKLGAPRRHHRFGRLQPLLDGIRIGAVGRQLIVTPDAESFLPQGLRDAVRLLLTRARIGNEDITRVRHWSSMQPFPSRCFVVASISLNWRLSRIGSKSGSASRCRMKVLLVMRSKYGPSISSAASWSSRSWTSAQRDCSASTGCSDQTPALAASIPLPVACLPAGQVRSLQPQARGCSSGPC